MYDRINETVVLSPIQSIYLPVEVEESTKIVELT